MKVRTRFAPSPTGFLHVGGIRTALFAYAYAKRNGGEFILRIEDTDKSREVEGSIEHIQKSLKWLGLSWDEGPEVGGEYGPYLQSQRLEIYKQWAEKLIEKGLAYTDTFSQEEVNGFREEAKQQKKAFLFRNYRPEETSVEDDWYGKLPLRFKVEDIEATDWHDEVWGDLHAGEEALDDFVLIKADGYPTYNFAHVVDDHLMQISHVMRGEEFLASVPKFISLHKALEIELPKFATMPFILGKGGGKKLSKRDGAKDVLEYKKDGLLPEAVFNFIASLGWNDGTDKEIFLPSEIVETFELNRIQKSGAQFDESKLSWVNWQHLKQLGSTNPQELATKLKLEASDTAIKLAITKANDPQTLRDQVSIFTEAAGFNVDTADLSIIDPSLNTEVASHYLSEAVLCLSHLEDYSTENIEKSLRAKMAELEAKPRAFLNLIRWTASNKQVSPNLFEMLEVLGKDETIQRLENAVS